MTFDRKNFDWKQAIFDMKMEIVRIGTILDEHLEHHKRWRGIMTRLYVGAILSLSGAVIYLIIDGVKKWAQSH